MYVIVVNPGCDDEEVVERFEDFGLAVEECDLLNDHWPPLDDGRRRYDIMAVRRDGTLTTEY
jgi:hypothetical protein